jgi:Fe-S-cluster containining protein
MRLRRSNRIELAHQWGYACGVTQPAPMTTSRDNPCQSCGACCAYSRNWPRFSTEDDAALDLIPKKFVNERQSGMNCDGDRCTALTGKVGEATACGIYDVRPDVCRACMPGDPECALARRRHGLAELVIA